MSASENELGSLHALVAKLLAEKLSGDSASASDFSNAIKFLKDNNITSQPSDDNELGNLERTLAARRGVPKASEEDLADALAKLEFDSTRMN